MAELMISQIHICFGYIANSNAITKFVFEILYYCNFDIIHRCFMISLILLFGIKNVNNVTTNSSRTRYQFLVSINPYALSETDFFDKTMPIL